MRAAAFRQTINIIDSMNHSIEKIDPDVASVSAEGQAQHEALTTQTAAELSEMKTELDDQLANTAVQVHWKHLIGDIPPKNLVEEMPQDVIT